jgi:DNA polymerase-3 subunit epsilon
MLEKTSGMLQSEIEQTPIAITDFETTGLTPGIHRVVEVAVIRIEPGKNPFLAFDTLINPEIPVSATEIHGITDEDVADAPKFQDIAGDLIGALSGAVFASYNVYFDIRFLEYELSRFGIRNGIPYICLMYMRPLLGIGERCCLDDACKNRGIKHSKLHIASTDAWASASVVFQNCLDI